MLSGEAGAAALGSIIALGRESSGNYPESSQGWSEPAGLNGMQALLCSAPRAQAAVILAAGFIGEGMRLAGAACASRRGPAGPRLRAGPAERGWGRRGRAETPPLGPGEVLFLGSRAGATALPAPSAPACKSGRDDKWRRGIWAGSRRRCRAGAVLSLRQSHPEQRRDTQEPWSRGKGTGWMVLGSSNHQMCLGQT